MDAFSRDRMKPRKPKPKVLPLDRKPRPNPKYEDVAPAVDSGHNMRKHMERLDEIRQYYKFRPDEIFRRITVTSLVSLMIEVAKLELQEEDIAKLETLSSNDDVDSAIGNDNDDNGDLEPELNRPYLKDTGDTNGEDFGYPFGVASRHHASSAIPGSGQSVIESVVYRGKQLSMRKNLSSSVANLIQGVRDPLDFSDSASVTASQLAEDERAQVLEKRPYLLLDVRDSFDYENFHIVTAESYPQSRLSRSINFESKAMLRFKNRPEKLIVLYDEDENIASKCAKTLVQRGYDNVFMLSGGLKVSGILFPEVLISRKERLDSEEEIILLEEALEDAIARKGTSRLSISGPGRLSALSISQPNLTTLGGASGSRVPLRRLESALSQKKSAGTARRRTNKH